jgi:hypothetical protein
MRNLLAFLAAGALTVLGLGWYLGWYHLHSTPAADGHQNVTIDIDAVKVGQDLYKAEQSIQKKLAERGQQAGDKGAPPADKPAGKGAAHARGAGGGTPAQAGPGPNAPPPPKKSGQVLKDLELNLNIPGE